MCELVGNSKKNLNIPMCVFCVCFIRWADVCQAVETEETTSKTQTHTHTHTLQRQRQMWCARVCVSVCVSWIILQVCEESMQGGWGREDQRNVKKIDFQQMMFHLVQTVWAAAETGFVWLRDFIHSFSAPKQAINRKTCRVCKPSVCRWLGL